MERSWLLRPEEPRHKAPYRFSVPRILALIIITALIVGLVVVVRMVPDHPPPPPPAPDHYRLALHVALRFFHAQRSGVLPSDNNVSWRGDSCVDDGVSAHLPYTKDLVGGYYEGGDAIKFNLPTSFGLTILSWSVIEYHSKYEAAGELLEVKEIIRWGTDYLLKNFDSSSQAISDIVYQVGVGSREQPLGFANDRTCWMRPEDIVYDRPVLRCGSCSDVAAEMAAALAAASIVFRDEHDGTYSDRLAHGASLLFEFAKTRKDRYSTPGTDVIFFYNSTGYWDELLWAGTWLYFATGEESHLEYATDRGLAEDAGAFRQGPDFGILTWDSKLTGAQVLLTRLRMLLNPGYPSEDLLAEFHSQTQAIMCSYLPNFTTFNRTRGGLILLNGEKPAPLRYVVTAAFLATVFGDYLKALGVPGWNCGPTFYDVDVLRDFSESQVGYILGKNPRNMSYLVGYGDRYPTHVHHRGASIPLNATVNTCEGGYRWRDSQAPNPNTVIGAMVAGPDRHDHFYDDRNNDNYTEATISSNAGLIAALVALSGDRTIGVDRSQMFVGIPPLYPTSPPPSEPWKP